MCLACGAVSMLPCLDLGPQPMANDFKNSPHEPETAYPLAVELCPECHHLQLTYFLEPDLMFKHYLYVSGTSATYRKYMEWFADIAGSGRVLDIGCNDGTQLDVFKARGCETWGIDPAENLFPISSAKHRVSLGYFEDYNPGVTFDIMNAQNVFAHNRDPLGFLMHAKTMMHSNTRFYIQTSQADMVHNGEFDTIYHEHINFFNVMSFKKLTERAGLVLLDVHKTPIHGTSYMFVVGLEGTPDPRVEQELAVENARGLHSTETYSAWADKCRAFRDRVSNDLRGKSIVAYGAAAKGNTLLNFLRLKPDVIIDDNPLKHGKYSPGMRVPVCSSEYIKTIDRPVVFLPLAWNLYDEIKSKLPDGEFYKLF